MRYMVLPVVLTIAILTIGAPTGSAAGESVPLIDAVRKGDRAGITSLLSGTADVNARTADGATALHWATHLSNSEVVQMLIRRGADVNAANQFGATPLYLAALNGDQPMVEMLLAAGAKANAALASGETVLMTAARTGRVGNVKALLTRGADPNASESSHRQTALMWAAYFGHADIVAALLGGGADVHARSTARRRRVAVGERTQMSGLTTNTLMMDLGGFTPLLFAAAGGNAAVAEALVTAGANVNDETPAGVSALALAAHSGNGAVARVLATRGADVNAAKGGYSPLHAAVLRGDQGLVELLLSRGAQPNATLASGTPVRYYSRDFALSATMAGATPLWLAATYLEPEIMRVLAKGGADPALVLANGIPLAHGVISDAPIDPTDRRGAILTPAEVAAIRPGEEERQVLRTLEVARELGADMAALNRTGDTALHRASGRGYVSVMRFLVGAGVPIDAVNKAGDTSLHVAAQRGMTTAIQFLAENKANLGVKNARGQTALTAAMTPLQGFQATFANQATEDSRRRAAELLRQLGAPE